MHVIICGGRDTHLTPDDLRWLTQLRIARGITTVFHGNARGVDTSAKIWAELEGLHVHAFPANWQEEGRAAGPLRNACMLASMREAVAGGPCAVIQFPGGRGTADMVAKARAAGVPAWERDADRPQTAQAASSPQGVPTEKSGQATRSLGHPEAKEEGSYGS